jgi:hypothetical protein
MKLLLLPGHWYSDARPDGRFVAARFGGGVTTDRGPLPLRDLQWLRIAPDGVRCAGTGATDGDAWEWDGDESLWRNCGPFKAPRAVIYLADGSLKVERDGAGRDRVLRAGATSMTPARWCPRGARAMIPAGRSTNTPRVAT